MKGTGSEASRKLGVCGAGTGGRPTGVHLDQGPYFADANDFPNSVRTFDMKVRDYFVHGSVMLISPTFVILPVSVLSCRVHR